MPDLLLLTQLSRRSADTIIYRDPHTNQLVPFRHDQNLDRHSTDCPTCGRPWHSQNDGPAHDLAPNSPDDQPTFITHDYFEMLARSLPGSAEPSQPPSPRRRLAQPVRSRLRPPSTRTQPPPPDAEFVTSEPAPVTHAQGISEAAFVPNYFEKFFVEERELGRGGRGVVLLVKHLVDGFFAGRFACKRVPVGDDHAWLEKVLIEVRLLTTLSHQNLVSYQHVWLQDYQASSFGPKIPYAFILQQYCNGGDMHNYVLGSAQATTTTQDLKERIRRRSKGESDSPRQKHEPKRLHFDEIYSFFRDITSGLRFLHHNNYIHRDLKPSNCLLHTVGGETRVLVSDFGEVQYEYATRKSTGATGTISYCAPEVLRRITPGGPYENFTSKSDIFSLGMILHFLCFANLPYRASNVLHEEKEDVDELRSEILSWGGFDDQRKSRPELPGAIYAFLKRLLSLEPDVRPSADDVLQVVTSGRLDDLPTTRRKNSMEPEELTPGRRIQKLDSPRKGNSPQRGVDNQGSQKRRKGSRLTAETSTNDFSPESTFSGGSDGESSSPPLRQSSAGQRQASGNGPSTVIIRPRQSSTSAPTSPIKRSSTSPSPVRRQLLLESAHSSPQTLISRTVTRVKSFAEDPITSPSLRMAILGLKLLSTLQPCLYRGINATTAYPVIAIALAEFSVQDYRVWKATLAFLIHLGILGFAMRYNKLCRHPGTTWEWDGD